MILIFNQLWYIQAIKQCDQNANRVKMSFSNAFFSELSRESNNRPVISLRNEYYNKNLSLD